MYWGWGFGGMHFFWWFFWILAIAMFFTFAVPVPRRRYSQLRETPLDLLRRRYAAGELTTAEYDERLERLDAARPGQDSRRPLGPSPTTSAPTAEHPPH
jgi:putative membrane protein